MNGGDPLNFAESFKEFCNRLQEWYDAKHVLPPKFTQEFQDAENLSLEDLNTLTRDDCFNNAYMLYQLADYINTEKASLTNIVRWCEESLSKIVASHYNDTSQYAKHEIKVAEVINENAVASKIAEWKLVAQGRLEPLSSREQNIRKKAECLMEKGRRK